MDTYVNDLPHLFGIFSHSVTHKGRKEPQASAFHHDPWPASSMVSHFPEDHRIAVAVLTLSEHHDSIVFPWGCYSIVFRLRHKLILMVSPDFSPRDFVKFRVLTSARTENDGGSCSNASHMSRPRWPSRTAAVRVPRIPTASVLWGRRGGFTSLVVEP